MQEITLLQILQQNLLIRDPFKISEQKKTLNTISNGTYKSNNLINCLEGNCYNIEYVA